MDYAARIEIKRRDEEGSRYYDCPVCKTGEVKVKDNVFYGKCNHCGATLIDYKPLEHQEAFHASNAQYRMNIGGFGSGKTTASCAEIAAHALSTPFGRSLITAPTLSLVKDAVIPELIKFLPEWFLEITRLNPSPYFRLTNGHEILVYSSADQEKLRSLNLTAFYIEEASGVAYSIFDQLMTRLRNKAAVIKDLNGDEIGYKFMGIVSSNPEDGWIKDHFLLVSDKIIGSPSVDVNIYKNLIKKEVNRHFHTFISSTRDNKYIPKEFIERMSAGKSAKWIRKYVDCYLDVREGAVFGDFTKYLIEPFEIPKYWLRLGGFDPGYNDPTANPLAAINPDTGQIVVYDDYEIREQPVSYHAGHIVARTNGLKFYLPIQADPSVEQRNGRDGKTYRQYFYELSGIHLEPGNNDILFGIEKLRDYMVAGKLVFFNNLDNLKYEAREYKYPDAAKSNTNVPIDKYNHLWDALRYMIAPLPQNPFEMEEIFYSTSNPFKKIKDNRHIFSGDTIKQEKFELDEDDGIYLKFK